jgi:hypothetical protein
MTICKNAKVNYWVADMDLASMKPMPYISEDGDDDDENNDDEEEEDAHAEATSRTNGDEADDEFLDDMAEQERARLERRQKRFDERLAKNPTKDDMVVFKRLSK